MKSQGLRAKKRSKNDDFLILTNLKILIVMKDFVKYNNNGKDRLGKDADLGIN